MEGEHPLSGSGGAAATTTATPTGSTGAEPLQLLGAPQSSSSTHRSSGPPDDTNGSVSGTSTSGMNSPMDQPATPGTPPPSLGAPHHQLMEESPCTPTSATLGGSEDVSGTAIDEAGTSPMEVTGGSLIRSTPTMVGTPSTTVMGSGSGVSSSGSGGLLGTTTNLLHRHHHHHPQEGRTSIQSLLSTAATSGTASSSTATSGVASPTGTNLGSPVGQQQHHSSTSNSHSSTAQPQTKKVELEIAPTTGGSFTFVIDPNESIEGLKKAIGKKLKVGKEHICLLHRDRLLEGSKRIRDYGLADGSRVSLVPSVETGLLTQRPEQSVLEALEGLNETQVGDFLSGKSPLNLTMRLGDHVMLIQLQLSKGSKGSSSSTTSSSTSSSSTAVPSTSTSTATTTSTPASASTATNRPSTETSSATSSQQPPRQRPSSSSATSTTTTTTTNPPSPSTSVPSPSTATAASSTTSTSASTSSTSSSTTYEHDRLNTLAEASRNLSNTLKKLSSHVIKEDDDSITNHMQHHGKGVYSGTFSGTLNPALQDGLGKPKKHVSTIIHILNDLLGGMDPSKCTHISTGSSTGGTTTTSPVSPGSSLSTDLHNKRRQLRRRQPEHHQNHHHHSHHHKKGEGSGTSSTSTSTSSDPTMKRSRFAPPFSSLSSSTRGSGSTGGGSSEYWNPSSPCCNSGCSCADTDHQYHHCRNSGSSPGGTSTEQGCSAGNRERENEQLRQKMELLKENLRLRKEKMMLRSGRAAAAAAAGGNSPAANTAGAAPTAAS